MHSLQGSNAAIKVLHLVHKLTKLPRNWPSKEGGKFSNGKSLLGAQATNLTIF